MFTFLMIALAFFGGWILMPRPEWAETLRNRVLDKINQWLDSILDRSDKE